MRRRPRPSPAPRPGINGTGPQKLAGRLETKLSGDFRRVHILRCGINIHPVLRDIPRVPLPTEFQLFSNCSVRCWTRCVGSLALPSHPLGSRLRAHPVFTRTHYWNPAAPHTSSRFAHPATIPQMSWLLDPLVAGRGSHSQSTFGWTNCTPTSGSLM